MFILDANNIDSLSSYLISQGWLSPDEAIQNVSKPGEGNMNYVLRIDTGWRTFIIKQSRNYVEKYPQIAAPVDRVIIEGAFYQKVKTSNELSFMMPSIIGLDPENCTLAMQDLGLTNDYSYLYNSVEKLDDTTLKSLLEYLHILHKSYVNPEGDPTFLNIDMRKLNHEHIFHYPFLVDNSFDLDTITLGLQTVANRYKSDATLKEVVTQVGNTYLEVGNYLLHGDFYPGSWLSTLDGTKVIDPEFCFYGPREFDVAILKAHLILSGQDETIMNKIPIYYNDFGSLGQELLDKMTGIEIMRRLIGLAQLPLVMDLKTKESLLIKAYKMITE